MQVYPLNPRAFKSTGQRKAPNGKDDLLEAWSFADALRADGQNWKPLRPEDPPVKKLRLLENAQLIPGCFRLVWRVENVSPAIGLRRTKQRAA
jgi:hypothetical protein